MTNLAREQLKCIAGHIEHLLNNKIQYNLDARDVRQLEDAKQQINNVRSQPTDVTVP